MRPVRAARLERGVERWYVWPEGCSRAQGPFAAHEVAYRIFSKRVGPRDLVIDGHGGGRYVVADHRALARWLEPGPETALKLYRSVLRGTRARAAREGRRTEALLPSWAPALLTAEQRRAFRILDVDLHADEAELTRRYRALALHHHPDRGGDPRRMRAINRAFQTLRPIAPA